MTVEKFYKPTAKIFIRSPYSYRPTVFLIKLSENWLISSTQLIMTTTNKYKPTYILDTTTTIHNQRPAGNTRLCAPAGWHALSSICSRIHFFALRKWSSRKPQMRIASVVSSKPKKKHWVTTITHKKQSDWYKKNDFY